MTLMRGVEPGREERTRHEERRGRRRGTKRAEASDEQRSASEAEQS